MNSKTNNSNSSLPTRVDIFDIGQALVAQWKQIVFVTVTTTVLALIWAVLATPVYRAEVVMLPVEADSSGGDLGGLVSQFGGLASLAGVSLSSDKSKEESIAVLLSRRFTVNFVESNDMMPLLFAENWNDAVNDWDVERDEDIPSKGDAFKLFDSDIRKLTEDPTTGLITLSIEWKDRELVAEWANALVARANADIRVSAIAEARKSIEYLSRELEKTSVVGVQQAIFRLIESQINVVMLANVREEYAFKVIDPAVVPDTDRYVWPMKILIVVLGFVIGLTLGLLFALVWSSRVLQDRSQHVQEAQVVGQ